MDLLVSGKILRAEQALSIGLSSATVTHVAGDSSKGVEEALAWLQKKVQGTPEVVQAAKKVVLNGMNRHTEEVLAKERDIFTSVWAGPAHHNAMNRNIKHK